MCGRYASSRRAEDLVEEFEVEATDGDAPGRDPDGMQPDYNVAPTKAAPVVLERRPRDRDRAGGAAGSPDGEAPGAESADGGADGAPAASPAEGAGEAAERPPVRWLRLLTWGLVPSWAKDRSVGNRMINARAETLLERPAYKRAALARRCLVPADGWYEWQVSPVATDARGKPRKQPFYMSAADGHPIAIAGLYELWRDDSRHADDPEAWLATYVVLTTDAEPGLDVVHDRMPLVLPRDRWDTWLDPEERDPDTVRALIRPSEPGRFTAVPVSARVNAVVNNGPELVAPLPLGDLRGVVDPATGEIVGGGEVPLF